MARYAWAVLILTLLAIGAGYGWVHWNKSGPGAGLYSRHWQPEPVFGYWDPARFYEPVERVQGVFEGEECITCHAAVTPGIVADWRASGHAAPAQGDAITCNQCHGNDHAQLRMPTPDTCGGCHETQHAQFEDERRFGFPSHALAMERVYDSKHFADKPKAEVSACMQCHSVATKCDSCHTRHAFSAAEARRPEACVTCHSGPPHPDDDTYFASAHGQRYLAEGDDWDWSRPLRKGNYAAPGCAYCHMTDGKHQVADKTIWKFGLQQVNPLTSGNQVRRRQWVEMCADCHAEDWSAEQLAGLDAERREAWVLLHEAEGLLKDLRADDRLHPAAGKRPPYPMDLMERLRPRARIGFLEGQASAFYNVSPIERDYFEMWYFDNLGAYKGAAHGDAEQVRKGHAAMAARLARIEEQARELRALGDEERTAFGRRAPAGAWWDSGAYTDHNRERN
jgi:hydroxylamine dehydrogenase